MLYIISYAFLLIYFACFLEIDRLLLRLLIAIIYSRFRQPEVYIDITFASNCFIIYCLIHKIYFHVLYKRKK